MRSIFISLIFSTMVFFLTTSCGKAKESKGSQDPHLTKSETNYDVLHLGEIPIGLWVTPPDDYRNTHEYAKIKDCGLNFVNGFHYRENDYTHLMEILDYCEENDLKFFTDRTVVVDEILEYSKNPSPELLKKFTDDIKPYKDHPAFVGELLMDEPGKPLFEAIAAFSLAFDKLYPDKIAHVNLFPTYATGGIQAINYEDYINSWIETQSPKHLSYDSYALLTDDTIIEDYFYNLDLIREKTKVKKIPFWTFIQTLSIAGTPGVPDKREPSEIDIRWQVWSNLAFGAKGIQYFCYWTPGSGKEQFGDALIGLDGEKTVRYEYVKKLNSDINAIGKILLTCDAEGVIQSGMGNYQMYNPLDKFGDIESVLSNGSIVGCFTSNAGDEKVLITTLTPDKEADIVLHVNDKVTTVKVWRNGKMHEITVEGNQLDFQVAAGEAILVEF